MGLYENLERHGAVLEHLPQKWQEFSEKDQTSTWMVVGDVPFLCAKLVRAFGTQYARCFIVPTSYKHTLSDVVFHGVKGSCEEESKFDILEV